MSSYFFISAPADPTKIHTISKVKDALSQKQPDLAEVLPIQLPEFKVGTLDTLYVLSDELQKQDPVIESLAFKLSDALKSISNSKSNLAVGDKSIDLYLKTWSWNSMKYRVDKSLKELVDIISQEVNSIDTLMKTKLAAYSQMKGQLQGLQRKQTGNLSIRNINDVVKKEHFVLDSEYLTTLLVAVPNKLEGEWEKSYETLTQMVVPRSTLKIAQDEEYCLFTVTLFQKVVEEFINKAREHKFIVRDFKWDPEQIKAEQKALQDISNSEKEQSASLMRLCKTNFGEIFSCWIHIKAIRVFIESILRYGLPPNFQAMVIKVQPKHVSKAKEVLNKHFEYLSGGARLVKKNKGVDAVDDELEANLALLMGEKDYAPFVFFHMSAPA